LIVAMAKPPMIQNDGALSPNRRQLLRLAIASVLVINGCAMLRGRSDLDAAQDDLRNLLDSFEPDSGQNVILASIARRIENQSSELVTEQQEFLHSFDTLMNKRDVTETQLSQIIDAYNDRRRWLRDDLIRLQDDLHAALSPEDWTEVIQVLNRKGEAIASTSIGQ